MKDTFFRKSIEKKCHFPRRNLKTTDAFQNHRFKITWEDLWSD